MSGTSIDGIDAALVHIEGEQTRLIKTHSHAIPADIRDDVVALATGPGDDVHRLGRTHRALGLEFAAAARGLLDSADTRAKDVRAIGSHGQTVRHYPCDDAEQRYTLQIGDPATIAERTGITTVADFRSRDIAAGGQGAPLVPLFHGTQFGQGEEVRAIVNIGGIANATLLRGSEVLAGFDCGPGNTLLDAWVRRERGESYDAGGAWAAEHSVDETLLRALSSDAYLLQRGPRSTGPERFNLAWLESKLRGGEEPGTVQATLTEFTALAIVGSIADSNPRPGSLFVCGGGARNTDLMRRLHERLTEPAIRLGTTDELGLAAEWVEACAFAWLARRAIAGLPGNSPRVTGAAGKRILGAVYAAG